MGQYKHECFSCGGLAEDNDLAPMAIRLQATRAGAYSAFMDFSAVPGWMHFLFATQAQAVELCATCAAEHITISPELIEKLAGREVEERRVPHERYFRPMLERTRRDHAEHINRAAKRLAKATAPKKGA